MVAWAEFRLQVGNQSKKCHCWVLLDKCLGGSFFYYARLFDEDKNQPEERFNEKTMGNDSPDLDNDVSNWIV